MGRNISRRTVRKQSSRRRHNSRKTQMGGSQKILRTNNIYQLYGGGLFSALRKTFRRLKRGFNKWRLKRRKRHRENLSRMSDMIGVAQNNITANDYEDWRKKMKEYLNDAELAILARKQKLYYYNRDKINKSIAEVGLYYEYCLKEADDLLTDTYQYIIRGNISDLGAEKIMKNLGDVSIRIKQTTQLLSQSQTLGIANDLTDREFYNLFWDKRSPYKMEDDSRKGRDKILVWSEWRNTDNPLNWIHDSVAMIIILKNITVKVLKFLRKEQLYNIQENNKIDILKLDNAHTVDLSRWDRDKIIKDGGKWKRRDQGLGATITGWFRKVKNDLKRVIKEGTAGMVGRGGDLPNPIYFPISDKLFTIYTKTFNEKEKANKKLDQYVFDINKKIYDLSKKHDDEYVNRKGEIVVNKLVIYYRTLVSDWINDIVEEEFKDKLLELPKPYDLQKLNSLKEMNCGFCGKNSVGVFTTTSRMSVPGRRDDDNRNWPIFGPGVRVVYIPPDGNTHQLGTITEMDGAEDKTKIWVKFDRETLKKEFTFGSQKPDDNDRMDWSRVRSAVSDATNYLIDYLYPILSEDAETGNRRETAIRIQNFETTRTPQKLKRGRSSIGDITHHYYCKNINCGATLGFSVGSLSARPDISFATTATEGFDRLAATGRDAVKDVTSRVTGEVANMAGRAQSFVQGMSPAQKVGAVIGTGLVNPVAGLGVAAGIAAAGSGSAPSDEPNQLAAEAIEQGALRTADAAWGSPRQPPAYKPNMSKEEFRRRFGPQLRRQGSSRGRAGSSIHRARK